MQIFRLIVGGSSSDISLAPYTRFAGNPRFICFEFAGNPEIVCFEFAGEIKIALFCGIDSIITLWIRGYSNGKFTTEYCNGSRNQTVRQL